jgi:iron complex outermembrane receptor protein
VVTLNYGFNEARVTGTVPGQAITNAVGSRFVNAPKHKVGFWTRYQVESINTAFAFGGEYVSERVGFDREKVKPYSIFDASIIKTFDFAEVMFRVENIFDKTYAVSGFGLRNGSFPGEPRTVFLEIRKKF